jgi:hypothetical protein
MGRVIVGLLFAIAGALMVIKSEWFYQNFGSISWAEEHLGSSGGSRFMYKLIGIAFIFIGFTLVTNMFNAILMATIGRLYIR